MSRTKGPTTNELLVTMNELLYTMLSCMACPDCDGTGRAPVGAGRSTTNVRVERTVVCECRKDAGRVLQELADDDDDPEDVSDEDLEDDDDRAD